jgi:hypothetical protein
MDIDLLIEHGTAVTVDASRMVVLPGLTDTHGHGPLNMIETVGEHPNGADWRELADPLLPSFEELPAPLFVAGPFTQALPLRIWNAMRFGIEPTITAVSTLLIGVTAAVLATSAARTRCPPEPPAP